MSERLHRRGGYREKAGRPTNKARGIQTRQTVSLTLNPDTVAALDAWASENKLSRSAAADNIIAESLAAWIDDKADAAALDADGLLPGLVEAPEIHG